MKNIVAHSTNKKLLIAAMETLREMGIQVDSNWNIQQVGESDIDHIILFPDRMEAEYHNHSGSNRNKIYELPAQWDAFMDEVKDQFSLTIGEYRAEFRDGMVHFGCQSFTYEKLVAIHQILTGPIQATIKIHGKTVTAHMVESLMRELSKFKEWKVGDALTESFLNCEIPRLFHGYGNGWQSRKGGGFSGDRIIDKIEMKDGKMAASVSGTYNLWIAVESLNN